MFSMKKLANLKKSKVLQVCIVYLRYLLAMAFIPAGMTKVMYEPFAPTDKVDVFYEFVTLIYQMPIFYQTIGLLQLVAAFLMMTQRFALLGTILYFPIIFTITLFTWSANVLFTHYIVTLISLGILFLLFWDIDRWKGVFIEKSEPLEFNNDSIIHKKLWRRGGLVLFLFGVLEPFIFDVNPQNESKLPAMIWGAVFLGLLIFILILGLNKRKLSKVKAF